MLLDNENKCLSTNPSLIYDEACLDIINVLNQEVIISGQYDECERCVFQNFTTLFPNETTSLLIKTKYPMQMNAIIGNESCGWHTQLFEHYRYGWNITEKCSPIYIKKPADNEYLPILSAFIILFICGTAWYMVKCIYKCIKNNETWRRYVIFTTDIQNDLGTPSPSDGALLVIERPPVVKKHPNRIKSIDVFRGMCIILMIFVNYGGGQYWFFKHSIWNGLTVADLVFPWFVWIMGLSYSISLNGKLRRAVPRRQLVIQVLKRSAILILLGLILNSHDKKTALSSLRYPGVLQRLGVTYLFIGLIESIFAKRTFTLERFPQLHFIQDIIMAWRQWIIILVFICVHTLVTFFVTVPGCGRGYLGPGGLHDGGRYYNCTGGVAGFIDRSVFGEHMYKNPTCHKMYETIQYFDPEGILATLTSIFLAYLGVQAGRTFIVHVNAQAKIICWLSWGVFVGLMGGILCNFSKNAGIIPVNKNLWSLSFVLVVGGFGFIIQAFLYLVVDVKHKWGGRPLFYPGMNSLILYVGHVLFKDVFPFCWIPDVKSHASYLGMNLWAAGLWVAFSIFLYKKNIFFHI